MSKFICCDAVLLMLISQLNGQHGRVVQPGRNAVITTLPLVGGSGGDEFIEICPAGKFLTGVALRTADDVDAIQHLCLGPDGSHRYDTPWHGGQGGSGRALICPASTPVVVGLDVGAEGQKTFIVNNIHLYCGLAIANQPQPAYADQVFDGPPVKGGRAPEMVHQVCPAGQIGIGVHGRSGAWLDALGLICGPPENPNAVKSIGRVRVTSNSRPEEICERAAAARARNSVAAPSLEAQCNAWKAQMEKPNAAKLNPGGRYQPSVRRESRKSEWVSMSGSNKCVGTAKNGSMENGTPLVIWDCHGNPDQQWTLTSETLLKNVSGKCVGTAKKGSMENGTPLVIWDCHGNPDQQWTLTSETLLKNVSGKCVGTANSGSMENGTPLVIWNCHGNPDQRWTLTK